MKTIKGLHFQPWIGPNWEKSKFGKLLLLGESHYLNGDKDTSNLTSLVVKNALSVGDEMKTPFFRITELIFGCKKVNNFGIMLRMLTLFKMVYQTLEANPNGKI